MAGPRKRRNKVTKAETRRKIYRAIRWIENLVYPPRCPICDGLVGIEEHLIHEKCKEKIYSVGKTVCAHCGKPLISDSREFCYDCTQKNKKKNKIKKSMSFEQGKSLFVYKGEIKHCIYRYKYMNRREYAAFFAGEALRQYADWIRLRKIDAIVAVPMYKKKERKRGYNQAYTFAKELSRQTGIPILKDAIRRTRDTKPLKLLSEEDRIKNLRGSFQIGKNIVQCYQVLVVDDIYTTGSTADTISQLLMKNGVKKVYFMSVCIGQDVQDRI